MEEKEKGLELIPLNNAKSKRTMWCSSPKRAAERTGISIKLLYLTSTVTGERISRIGFRTKTNVYYALKQHYWSSYLYNSRKNDKEEAKLAYKEGQTFDEYLKAQNLKVEESKEPFEIYKDKSLFACPYCGKTHLAEEFVEIKDDKIIQDEADVVRKVVGDNWLGCFMPGQWEYWCKTNAEGKIKYVCPECHSDCTNNPIITQDRSALENNIQLDGFSVFDKDDKVIVNVFFSCFYLNTNASNIAMKKYRARVVYNTVTGQAYIFPITDPKGKKEKKFSIVKMMNATYSEIPYWKGNVYSEIFRNKTIVSKVLDKVLERHNKDEKYKKACYECLSIDNDEVKLEPSKAALFISIMNRMPFLTPESINNLARRKNISYFHKNKAVGSLTYFSKTKTTDTENEAMGKILAKANIKANKTVRKLVSEDIINLFFIKEFKKHGFTKIDLLPRYLKYIKFYLSNTSKGQNSYEFIKDLIKEKGEVDALETLKVRDTYFQHLLVDTAYMWKKLKAVDLSQKSFLKGNLKDIHDKLEREVDKLKTQNIHLKYAKKEIEKFNHKVNDYDFRLVQETHELIRVGATMHICVGSYGEYVVSKSCYIVVAYDSKNVPVMCMEVNCDSKELRQAKAVCNNLIQEYKAEALREWVNLSGVKTDGCYDYAHIAQNNIQYDTDSIYKSRSDYHHLEINDDGAVVNRFGQDEDIDW